MKEYKVGEVFKLENEWHIVVHHDGCDGCVNKKDRICFDSVCGSHARKDGKNVIFQKVRI